MKPLTQLGVFGNPIEHSLSPRIHSLFAQAQQEHVNYQRYLATSGRFSRSVAQFFCHGGRGANVTLPFKQDAARLVTQLTERAQLAGAVNTLISSKSGQLVGDNTDGEGLAIDLENKGFKVSGRSLTIFGAGGSARGILPLLLAQQPKHLYLINRTVEKAEALKSELKALGLAEANLVQVLSSASAIEEPVELLINATSSSLTGQCLTLPPILADDACGYDLMYAAKPTVFMHQLTQVGCKKVSDGLGMLVEQAASSYQLWMGGERPDTTSVMSELRKSS
ncbi:shikimate dehydrogenase [Idiomarina ramblicola]|uniref:Shikimate dehydrogenase (NADP(+)) n=1 Tax=Idiomarina ramblicola TaxID=263724 RepID=A0A432Z0C5_9GAMM|nr:shikimate dehydrogenase [Idiomarina ramblicola]RUO69636.1 shikimate dehydrogenase [Idiomarina ramblicola]